MNSPQKKSSKVAQKNSLEQHSSSYSDNHVANRVPIIKSSGDWEQPDFEELDTCMEVTAYIYHWQ